METRNSGDFGTRSAATEALCPGPLKYPANRGTRSLAPGRRDVEAGVRTSVARVRHAPFLPHTGQVRGFVYDVRNGSDTQNGSACPGHSLGLRAAQCAALDEPRDVASGDDAHQVAAFDDEDACAAARVKVFEYALQRVARLACGAL